jgi:hypothetical protein
VLEGLDAGELCTAIIVSCSFDSFLMSKFSALTKAGSCLIRLTSVEFTRGDLIKLTAGDDEIKTVDVLDGGKTELLLLLLFRLVVVS